MLKSRFSYNNLTEREITFYTRLTMQLFLWVLTKVSICAKLCVKTMSMQDHLLLVLMKLRLGLLNRDLAFRFNMSDTSVSRIINQWIPNIANCLKGLIIWPENDITYSNIPESFIARWLETSFPKFNRHEYYTAVSYIIRLGNVRTFKIIWSSKENMVQFFRNQGQRSKNIFHTKIHWIPNFN